MQLLQAIFASNAISDTTQCYLKNNRKEIVSMHHPRIRIALHIVVK
jgi:hypothetical protein